MSTDLTIELADAVGELARLGQAFGDGGVNIEGLCAITVGGPTAEVHVLVDDAEAAFLALASAGIPVRSESEVLVIEVEDRPGVIGEVGSALGEAGISLDLIYLATATRLVIGADDLASARTILVKY